MWLRRSYYFNAFIAAAMAAALLIRYPHVFQASPAEAFPHLAAGAMLAGALWIFLVGRLAEVHLLRILAKYASGGYVIVALLCWQLDQVLTPDWLAAMIAYGNGLILLTFTIPEGLAGRIASGTEIRADWQDSVREAASQQERNRLSQELHDSIKQQIYAIQANLATVEVRWETDGSGVREAVGYARDSAREAMVEMNALLDQLQEAPVMALGLIESLRRQCEALGYRTGATMETVFDEQAGRDLAANVQQTIFRIVQEAFSNIARHARARTVKVSLVPRLRGEWELRIEDDGQGFDQTVESKGMGLASIRARAAQAGGLVSIFSGPGLGCTITVNLLPAGQPSDFRHHRTQIWSNALRALFLASPVWRYGWPALPYPLIFVALTIYHAVQYRKGRRV